MQVVLLSHGSLKSIRLLSEVMYEMSPFQEPLLGHKLFLRYLPTNCAFAELMNLAVSLSVYFPILESVLQTLLPSPLQICSIALSTYKYKSTILCDNVHEMTTCFSQKPLQMNPSPSCPGFLCLLSSFCTELNLLMWFV